MREAFEALSRIDTPWLVAAALAVLLAVALLGWWRERGRVGRANRARGRRARRAENEAERWLERQGYAVLERQVVGRFDLAVDGERLEVTCRADLLLERDGCLYVADVKTGEEAPNPALPATRRQLLEYLLAFAADGALVVDMRRRRVLEVSFPGLLGES